MTEKFSLTIQPNIQAIFRDTLLFISESYQTIFSFKQKVISIRVLGEFTNEQIYQLTYYTGFNFSSVIRICPFNDAGNT